MSEDITLQMLRNTTFLLRHVRELLYVYVYVRVYVRSVRSKRSQHHQTHLSSMIHYLTKQLNTPKSHRYTRMLGDSLKSIE